MAYGQPNYMNYAPAPRYDVGYGYAAYQSSPAVQQPYPEYGQGQMQNQQIQSNMGGNVYARIVTGREEAVAAQVFPDGSLWVFVDISHGKIFTKQVNPKSNMADFREYDLSIPDIVSKYDNSQNNTQYVEYATIAELNALKSDLEEIRDMISKGSKASKATKEAEN